MIFSTLTFLIMFLPLVLMIYYIPLRGKRSLQNSFLTLSSLFFYAWGEPLFVLIMLSSIFLNWLLAIKIDKYRDNFLVSKLILICVFFINLGILFIFKYLMFAIGNANLLFGTQFLLPIIRLPIGISFFTFQAMSYVIDVYRKNGQVQKKIRNVALYIAFFPQLIAGPIVRYKTIAEQIQGRTENFTLFSSGVHRFLIGLFKKIFIANSVAIIADYVFNADVGMLSTASYWIGAIMYTLQIYYDFSGYSDMAIGLGRMFGFEFLENFNYPYISKSISEFWTRWHMSLGNWFKDYVYFPLGGSRVKSKKRLILNLAVVWLFTGIWHGANWTFIIWGAFYWFLICLEKLLPKYRQLLSIKIIGWPFTMSCVLLGWVVFRAESLTQALLIYKEMFNMSSNMSGDAHLIVMVKENIIFIVAGIIFATPIFRLLEEKITINNPHFRFIYSSIVFTIFLVCISFMVKSAYNPFIYFNF